MVNFLTRPIKQLNIAPLIATLLLAGLIGQASGQTISYGNLSTSSANPNQNFTNILSMGQSFTAATSGSITSLTLDLGTINPSVRPVYGLELWSNSGGTTPLPSTLLATFVTDQHWNNNYLDPADSSHSVTFSSSDFSGNYSLVAGATYWLVIDTTDGANKTWGVSDTLAGPSAAYYLSTGEWGPLPLSGALGLEVETAVPEPSAYATIAGMAALGVAWAGRRRSAVHQHKESSGLAQG
jgi:hypothetical protein